MSSTLVPPSLQRFSQHERARKCRRNGGHHFVKNEEYTFSVSRPKSKRCPSPNSACRHQVGKHQGNVGILQSVLGPPCHSGCSTSAPRRFVMFLTCLCMLSPFAADINRRNLENVQTSRSVLDLLNVLGPGLHLSCINVCCIPSHFPVCDAVALMESNTCQVTKWLRQFSGCL